MCTIGVFDSGIGGLNICCEIFKAIPDAKIVYYADNENAPFGSKSHKEVLACASRGARYLEARGAEVIVLACNTATVAAVKPIRDWCGVPVVGTEPAIKPAESSGVDALYLATPLTAMEKGAEGRMTFDTTLLSAIIERFFGKDDLMSMLSKRVAVDVAGIVIGCTHYTYLVPYIRAINPKAVIFDGAQAVARQTKKKLRAPRLHSRPALYFHFTGKKEFSKYFAAARKAGIHFNGNSL